MFGVKVRCDYSERGSQKTEFSQSTRFETSRDFGTVPLRHTYKNDKKCSKEETRKPFEDDKGYEDMLAAEVPMQVAGFPFSHGYRVRDYVGGFCSCCSSLFEW